MQLHKHIEQQQFLMDFIQLTNQQRQVYEALNIKTKKKNSCSLCGGGI